MCEKKYSENTNLYLVELDLKLVADHISGGSGQQLGN